MLLADRKRGESALAYILARELAHSSLLHCRRGWQRLQAEEDLVKGAHTLFDAGQMRSALETGIRGTGQLVLFLYSREQEYEADLFALHLCRNAGFPVDQAIDGMRLLAALRHPDALHKPDYRPADSKLPATLASYLSSRVDPLVSLRRLLMERDGLVSGEEFGLFRYDRASVKLSPCQTGSVGAEEKPIILVHGLRGSKESFRDYLIYLGERKELHSRALLVFRHPGNASLARCGRCFCSTR